MDINLIIDGNYILNKCVFSLNKINELHGNLEIVLNKSVKSYYSQYGFSNVYFVSDLGKSWRKEFYIDYKGTRKKSDDIDWAFVYKSYDNFKQGLPNRVKLLEKENIEGDDWISYLVRLDNNSINIIISNDHDLKQLIKFSTSPQYMNCMSNEMFSSCKLFLPENYKIFLNNIRSNISDDIFELTNDSEFLSFFNNFIIKREVVLVNPTESFFTKLIQGDKSDNIKSVYITKTSKGKSIGIGKAGAKSIYNNYLKEFGDINLSDRHLFNNIADLICESKKASYTKIPEIKKNLSRNSKLINLMELPKNITKIMEDEFNVIK